MHFGMSRGETPEFLVEQEDGIELGALTDLRWLQAPRTAVAVAAATRPPAVTTADAPRPAGSSSSDHTAQVTTAEAPHTAGNNSETAEQTTTADIPREDQPASEPQTKRLRALVPLPTEIEDTDTESRLP